MPFSSWINHLSNFFWAARPKNTQLIPQPSKNPAVLARIAPAASQNTIEMEAVYLSHNSVVQEGHQKSFWA